MSRPETMTYLYEKQIKTFIKKNKDYGNSFDKSLDQFGLIASAIRMSDKLSRFVTLINNKAEVNDESIIDTLLDLSNYATMTVAYIEEKAVEEVCAND
jgi:hypothetical protein